MFSRKHPDYDVNPPSACINIPDRVFQPALVFGACGMTATSGGTAYYEAKTVDPQDISYYCDKQAHSCRINKSVGGPEDSMQAYDNMASAQFFWARAGSKVFLASEAEVLYIVNLLPCTITRIAAMKNTNFGPKLVTVPADWYTLYETDYDGYTITEIGMTQPLSQRRDIVTYPRQHQACCGVQVDRRSLRHLHVLDWSQPGGHHYLAGPEVHIVQH